MKVYRDIAQGTPEWFALRVNKVTASCFSDVLAKGQGKTRAKYLRRVVAEALTGKPFETFRNADMDRGQEQEPLARWAYELVTDHGVDRVAFVEHDTIRAGCSPDGLVVGKKRGAEIKCVIPTVQVETLLCGSYPSEHKAQVQGSMWITGYDEWDFCSYCPDMREERHRLYIYTVKRDDAYIKTLEDEVRRFLSEVDAILDQLGHGDGRLLERQLQQSISRQSATIADSKVPA